MAIIFDDEGYSGSHAELLEKHGWKGFCLTIIIIGVIIWFLL